MLDKVTGWVLCLPDNTTARSEGHVPFLSLQLSSNSRLIRVKRREVCSVFQFLTSSMRFEPHRFILRMVRNM